MSAVLRARKFCLGVFRLGAFLFEGGGWGKFFWSFWILRTGKKRTRVQFGHSACGGSIVTKKTENEGSSSVVPA